MIIVCARLRHQTQTSANGMLIAGSKKKMKGSLKSEDFMALLGSHFPYKTKVDLQNLRHAARYDQPFAAVTYGTLFEEDRSANQGKFAETLRNQHLCAMRHTYIITISIVYCLACTARCSKRLYSHV